MLLPKYGSLPDAFKSGEVKHYYDILKRKKASLFFKRLFDILFAVILTALLLIPMGIIAIAVKADSEGPVFFRQRRVAF